MNWSRLIEVCTQNEGEHPKAIVGFFIVTLQKHNALNPETPEYRDLLIFTSVGKFIPDIKKKKIQNSVVEWST